MLISSMYGIVENTQHYIYKDVGHWTSVWFIIMYCFRIHIAIVFQANVDFEVGLTLNESSRPMCAAWSLLLPKKNTSQDASKFLAERSHFFEERRKGIPRQGDTMPPFTVNWLRNFTGDGRNRGHLILLLSQRNALKGWEVVRCWRRGVAVWERESKMMVGISENQYIFI